MAETPSKYKGDLIIDLEGIPKSVAQILRNHPSFAESDEDDDGEDYAEDED